MSGPKFGLYEVQYRTSMNQQALKVYERYILDLDVDIRHEKQECVICFYSGKMGGAAITSAKCALCEIEIHSGNTNVAKLCKECAKEHNLCKHCGADIDLKNRRKL